jgi:uncharacterized membrane protein required for colicin V production
MSLFDIILLCIIAGFGLFGLWFGLISTLGSIAGTLLGVYLASRWYVPVAEWLINTTGWSPNFSKVVIFIIVFLIAWLVLFFILLANSCALLPACHLLKGWIVCLVLRLGFWKV